MKISSKKRINTEKHLKSNDSFNSFLIETSFNSDIDVAIRKEIDKKFSQSKINSEYKFPRKLGHKKTKSKQVSSKNSFENLGKTSSSHKISKSSTQALTSEKSSEKHHSKKVSFNLNIQIPIKTDEKKGERHLSCRLMKTDRVKKSPKQSPKFLEIYSKGVFPFTSKKVNTECFNRIFTPYSSNTKLINTTASMRLKKIYHSVKSHNLTESSTKRF
jgi:hypothetical protein